LVVVCLEDVLNASLEPGRSVNFRFGHQDGTFSKICCRVIVNIVSRLFFTRLSSSFF
jgi:hypothetical protein